MGARKTRVVVSAFFGVMVMGKRGGEGKGRIGQDIGLPTSKTTYEIA